MTDQTVLIVGGGIAGGTAAASLREEGFDGRVVVVTSEPRLPSTRPPLSKDVLTGDAEPQDTLLHEPAFWQGRDIEVRTGRTVTDLGRDIGAAALDDGDEVAWHHVVLATGASARPSPVAGAALDGAWTLRDADDALSLRTALAAAGHVAVVGSSWIGLEVAAAARAHDCEVTVVAPDEEPLAAVLGSEVGAAFRALHEDHGVVFRRAAVDRVAGGTRATGVALGDGEVLAADAVVLGTGVRPNTALARRAGLAVDAGDGGVRTDASLRTSDERVLAVGDVASHDHPRLGRLRVEHVEVARGHGRTAAKVVAGQDVVHDDLPLFYSDQYDLGMEYVGHARPDDVVVRGDLPERPFVAFYLDGDTVRAGMHADAWAATDVIRDLVGSPVDRAVLADTDVALEELVDTAVTD